MPLYGVFKSFGKIIGFADVRFFPLAIPSGEIFPRLAENFASVLGLHVVRRESRIKRTGKLHHILDIKLEKLAGVSQSKLKACPGFKVSLISAHMGDVLHAKNIVARYNIV